MGSKPRRIWPKWAPYVMALLALTGLVIGVLSPIGGRVAQAAPGDELDCSATTPYIYNLHSEDGADDLPTRRNRVERVNVNTGAVETLVSFGPNDTNPIRQQLNGLGITPDGRYLTFVSHSLERGTRDTPRNRYVYRYDLVAETLTRIPIPWNVYDLDADHLSRHGAVDPSTGIYYFATSKLDEDGNATDFVDLIAYNPAVDPGTPEEDGDDYPRNVWLAGTLHAPDSPGASGDMAFNLHGDLMFVISQGNSANLFGLGAGQLPTSPDDPPVQLDLSSVGPVSGFGAGNGVGVAYGLGGFLYVSYTNGTLRRVDPSTGAGLATVGSLGSGGGTTDLASCVAEPSTLTVVKDIDHRHDPADEFVLAVRRDTATGPLVGYEATTDGPDSGVQDNRVGPVPILTRSDDGTQAQRTYVISETGSGSTDLANYATGYECLDQADPGWGPFTGRLTGDQTRSFELVVTPNAADGTPRSILCTFSNRDLDARLTLTKTVTDPDNVAGDQGRDASEWTLTADGESTDLSGNGTPAEGAQASITDWVPPGTYDLSESALTGYQPVTTDGEQWSCLDTSVSPAEPVEVTNGAVTLESRQDVECTVTNRAVPGSVAWTKVDSSSDDLIGPSTWTLQRSAGGSSITVVDNGVNDTDDTLGALRVAGLSWGDYTLTETVPPPGYTAPADPSTTFTVGIGDQADGLDVALDPIGNDPILTGALAVVKAFPDNAPDWLDGVEYTGTYSCVLGESRQTGTWSVTGAGPADLSPAADQVPAGSLCTVTENDPAPSDLPDRSWAWNDPEYSTGGQVVIADDQTSTVTLTNSVSRVYGGFAVTKRLIGDADPANTYSGQWRCTYTGPDGQAGGGDDEVLTGPWGPITVGATWEWSSGDSGPIPLGASCAVTSEDRPARPDADRPSLEWIGAPDLGEPVPASAEAADASITVTNTSGAMPGHFSVTKTVRGKADPANAYSGSWACTYGEVDYSGRWGPIIVGETWTLPAEADVPQAAECRVTDESGRPARPVADDPTWSWQPPDLGTPTTTVAESPETAALITVTNTSVQRPPNVGTFTVAKQFTGDPSGLTTPDPAYEFNWRCTTPDQSRRPADGPGTFTLANGDAWSAAGDLPAGSECAVTEAAPPAPVSEGYVWSTRVAVDGDGSDSGRTATFMILAGGSVEVTYTNELRAKPGTGPGGPTLPRTGSSIPLLLPMLACLLTAIGVLLLIATHRRRRPENDT